jgi:hypothetical protein
MGKSRSTSSPARKTRASRAADRADHTSMDGPSAADDAARASPSLRAALDDCTAKLGAIARPAELRDVDSILQPHDRFEKEMAAWKDSSAITYESTDKPAERIAKAIEGRKAEGLILLTRELLDCRSPRGGGTEILAFVHWADSPAKQDLKRGYSGITCYISEVGLPPCQPGASALSGELAGLGLRSRGALPRPPSPRYRCCCPCPMRPNG